MAKNLKCPVQKPTQRRRKSGINVKEADPRFASIVRALARRAAREHYKGTCFTAKEDSDSED